MYIELDVGWAGFCQLTNCISNMNTNTNAYKYKCEQEMHLLQGGLVYIELGVGWAWFLLVN